MTKLINKHCVPCDANTAPLALDKLHKLIEQLDGWRFNDVETHVTKFFKFPNFYKTMAFVNAVAWIAHNENHHPSLDVGYEHVRVTYSTHAAKGLTENDFICAAKVDELFIISS